MYKALIIEDSDEISQLLKIQLMEINCDADIAHDGQLGLDMFAKGHYDIVILDLMLPSLDGISICREIRARYEYVPILMLTSKSSEVDRVVGLEMGADDYLTKPFSMLELLARVKAMFRRIEAMQSQLEKNNPIHNSDQLRENTIIDIHNLSLNETKREVLINKQQVDLTAKEFELLLYFAKHPGQVFNRLQLLDAIWGYSHDGYEHTVNSHINRLRGKIEKDPSQPEYILTVWGVGYKFNDKLH